MFSRGQHGDGEMKCRQLKIEGSFASEGISSRIPRTVRRDQVYRDDWGTLLVG
jgi:hypothetical protein